MKGILIRWAALAAAIALTAWLMPGVTVHGEGSQWVINLIIIAAVFGLVNAIIRPIVMFFTCPLIILTLGLFTLVINALMLSLTNWLLPNILTVSGFWTTFFASLIIAIIAGLLNALVGGDS
ncbi:MAG: phage holin family protein [Chloroflexi bacterium]|nr:MAG: phage holin family protein [Chloroflexota bacterium]